MGLLDAAKNQFRAVVTWQNPEEWEVFRKYTGSGDEVKNASSLVLQPGQGCMFAYEGKIKGVFSEPGLYSLDTDNHPFFTNLKKVLNFFESDHKTGLWFYRAADIVNVRWGTRIPITYNDPVYGFPVNLRAFGNFSIKITQPEAFFTRIVAAKEAYYAYELQELLCSRIGQPISHYLANARFSYAEVDSNLEKIAADAKEQTEKEFASFGFQLLDFRIEGASFDEDTNKRIAGISDVQADAKAAKLADVSFEKLQQMMALRDAARNKGGQAAQLITALNVSPLAQQPSAPSVKDRLKALKELFDDGLLDEDEYKQKKADIMKEL
ncbi:SPFH domain-containing protein [Chitinophaga sedimenti]|uniref:SPFH domain-containing protein n=1 Tax=Chitinophaga sedimenti TaxID=2033606 RepID=UPI002004A7A3|nr:SPFH domain-containing protein [Chitinophaga sedimenti]MCK7555561.1 SPFH domain-containing protein [Chitinophaga sedimenti]